MTIIEVFSNFQTQEQAVSYLETARWHGRPICPYCGSDKICRHVSSDREAQRWQCWDCHKTFSVTVGTIFHGTHIPLRSWFLVVSLMLNAKKSASACQIARDLGMRRPTVWSMMHRIREAMAKDSGQRRLLYGIVETDETYIGGVPRKANKRGHRKLSKRGKGTDKTPVLGAVERNGRVVAEPAPKGRVSVKTISQFLRKNVDFGGTLIMTDELPSYRHLSHVTNHSTINHQLEYANGVTHTNTIEGFWALLKRADVPPSVSPVITSWFQVFQSTGFRRSWRIRPGSIGPATDAAGSRCNLSSKLRFWSGHRPDRKRAVR